MDLTEYFGQSTHYFSESSGQMVALEEMPFNRAFYSHYKLLRQFPDDYPGTELFKAFTKIMYPTPADVREQLKKYGKACHMFIHNDMAARSKMYRAAKVAKKKVATYRHEYEKGYGWVEAVLETEVAVTIKSHRGS